MLKGPDFTKRPNCDQIRVRMRDWRLSVKEMVTIEKHFDTLKFEHAFFRNLLASKLDSRARECNYEWSIISAQSDDTLESKQSVNESTLTDYSESGATISDVSMSEGIHYQNNDYADRVYRFWPQIRTDFVVEFRSAWIEGHRLYIQTEFCDHNLKDIINDKNRLFSQPSDDDPSVVYVLALIDYFIAYELFEELTKSLNYLHTLDTPIIHRNLKPENILIMNNVTNNGQQFVKICNFGYAAFHSYSGQSHTRAKGDKNYMAPEVVRSKHYDLKSDIFSLGLICSELFGVNAYGFERTIIEKHLGVKDKYRCLHEPIQEMLTEPLYDQRPTCAELLVQMIGWRLSADELLKIEAMYNTINWFPNSDQISIFFRNFLAAKLRDRIDESAYEQPTDDVVVASIDRPFYNMTFTDYTDLKATDGDIIQIVGIGRNSLTIWAVYMGGGNIAYVCLDTKRLLYQSLESVCRKDSKGCRVNNLDELSESRQLSVRTPDSILVEAFRALKKYNFNIPTDNRKHNLRIHFVTKCRFGRQYCEQCIGKEMVDII
ncbi:unnamed protein product [Medioppia subpectinata]|uniref:Protein kinase domain-containing protein n=1 Tax=Medioppia subpectinata TaxID=1979941 RepID=A0A7R9KML3_9ACAR|nr:unnamed protein product [Medioppia subpectinata]CAG2106355.1 unnamed protein product [Medioppia subpectinata]